jgi:hypothetical protein
MDNSNRYIDGTYLKKNPTWDEEDSPYKAEILWKIINKNNLSPITICEVGCGAGGILKCLQDKFEENVIFQGYDISPDAINIAKQKENQKLTFYNQDFLKSNDNFDLIIVADVIEHLEDYFKFLREIKNRGTYFVFNIPLEAFVLAILDGNSISIARNKVGHIHIFTKDMVFNILNETKYDVVDWAFNMSSKKYSTFPSRALYFPRKLALKMKSDFLIRLLGGPSLTILAK